MLKLVRKYSSEYSNSVVSTSGETVLEKNLEKLKIIKNVRTKVLNKESCLVFKNTNKKEIYVKDLSALDNSMLMEYVYVMTYEKDTDIKVQDIFNIAEQNIVQQDVYAENSINNMSDEELENLIQMGEGSTEQEEYFDLSEIYS